MVSTQDVCVTKLRIELAFAGKARLVLYGPLATCAITTDSPDHVEIALKGELLWLCCTQIESQKLPLFLRVSHTSSLTSTLGCDSRRNGFTVVGCFVQKFVKVVSCTSSGVNVSRRCLFQVLWTSHRSARPNAVADGTLDWEVLADRQGSAALPCSGPETLLCWCMYRACGVGGEMDDSC